MAGNKRGGEEAAKTNIRRYGKDFYARIGAMGGRKSTTGGFAANRELAREAGRKGGMISRRRKVVNVEPAVVKPALKKSDFDLAA